MEKGERVKGGREKKKKRERDEMQGTGMHPSCGLVQKPFVPIVLHNLFFPSLKWEG